jgi:(S)-ureidoglycine aminohydrolase
MKRVLLALAALVAIAPLASAQLAPVKAGAYAWKDAQIVQDGGVTVRQILAGSTLDLDSLDVQAITLAPGETAEAPGTHDATEYFALVKDGSLEFTIAGKTKELPAGSVVVALPGDPAMVRNASSAPGTMYVFAYRSRAPIDIARGKAAGGSFMVSWADLKERTTASGTRHDVLNRPTAMFKRFEAHYSSVKPGMRNHATHSHRAEEFVMMTKGDVELLIGEAKPLATASDVVFLVTQVPHSLANVGKEQAQYLVIQGE